MGQETAIRLARGVYAVYAKASKVDKIM